MIKLSDVADYYGLELVGLENTFEIVNEKIMHIAEDDLFLTKNLHTSPSRYELSKLEFQAKCDNMLDYLKVFLSFLD